MCHPKTSDYQDAQQKHHVTYTVPTLDADIASITLLESRSLLAYAGTTGLRTWDAALHLGTYLCSTAGRDYVVGKNILELGAGTGFLSILCAGYIEAHHVLATDGSPEVIAALHMNARLNGETIPKSVQAAILEWDHPLSEKVLNDEGKAYSYDLVIGADLVGAKCSSLFSGSHTEFEPLVAVFSVWFTLVSYKHVLRISILSLMFHDSLATKACRSTTRAQYQHWCRYWIIYSRGIQTQELSYLLQLGMNTHWKCS